MGARTRGGRALCAYPSPQCVTLREALHGAPNGLARAFVQGFVRRDVALREKFYFAFNQPLTKRTFTNFDELSRTLILVEVPNLNVVNLHTKTITKTKTYPREDVISSVARNLAK